MAMLAHVLQDSKQDCTFISESPLIEKDAVVFRDLCPQYKRDRGASRTPQSVHLTR